MNLFYCFCVIISLIQISSCTNRTFPQSTVSINREDSIQLATLMQQFLHPNINIDSLNNVVSKLITANPSLQDVYVYNSIRNNILQGKLNFAERQLDTILANYNKDSLNYKWGKYLNLAASVAAYQNLQNESVAYFQKALHLYEKHDDKIQSSAIRYNLANIFLSRTDYKTAHEHASTANTDLKNLKDTIYLPMVKALLSITTLHTTVNFDDARTLAEKSLHLSEQYNNPQGLMLANYALGENLVKKDEYQAAITPLKKALELGEQFRQPQILLSAGASLLTCLLHLNNYEEAITHGLKTLGIAQSMNNEDIEYSLKKNIGKSYAGIGDYKTAFKYLEEAEQQYRYKSNIDNQKIIHDLLISYEAEKKNNIILAQENELQSKRIWVTILVSISILILSMLILLQKISINKRKTLEEKSEKDILLALTEGEDKERNRLAAELHDGVASHLAAATIALEIINENDSYSKPLNLIKESHKEIRNIAHNLMPVDYTVTPISHAIQSFCDRTSSNDLLIHFMSNDDSTVLNKNVAHSLYRATQELVQNAIKHAEAQNIYVQLLKDKTEIRISIEDDGKGIDNNVLQNSNGLKFLKDRLTKLGALLEIDSNPGAGTMAVIHYKI